MKHYIISGYINEMFGIPRPNYVLYRGAANDFLLFGLGLGWDMGPGLANNILYYPVTGTLVH
jgi:hypothetical protein